LLLVHAFLHYRVYYPLLALHSFPTRRSSDLGQPPRQAAHGVDLRPRGHRRPHEEGAPGRGLHGELRPARSGPARLSVGEPRPPLDRKSTRLNSSHVSISYAVFCLKKKTHHTT